MTGFAASGPPDGLIDGVAVEAERLGEDQLLVAELRVQLGDVDRCRSPTPAAMPGRGRRLRRARGRARRGCAPRCGARCRGSTPAASHTERARSPAAITTAAVPSVIGAMSASRSGSCVTGCCEHVVGGHVALAHRVRVRLGRCAARGPRPRRDRSSVAAARVEVRARLHRGHVDHRRPQRQRRSTGRSAAS